MTLKQTTMWTALPHGVYDARDGQVVRLSVFMSPRLESSPDDTTLGMFPEFVTDDPSVNWASTVAGMDFNVQFRRGAEPIYSVPARAVRITSAPDPAMWSKLFSMDTPVKGFEPPDLSATHVNSYSVLDSASALRDHFAAVASKPSLLYKIPQPEDLLNPPGLEFSPLTAHLSRDRQATTTDARTSAAPPPAPFDDFQAFHAPFVTDWNRITEAERAARLAAQRETDFHKAIAALGNYPALLPMLGIVVNLEIDVSETAITSLGIADRVRTYPTWPPENGVGGPLGEEIVPRVDAYPWTRCRFTAKTILGTTFFTSFRATSKDDEQLDGYLVVRDDTPEGESDPAVLTNIDVDLAMSRTYGAIEVLSQQIDQIEVRTAALPIPVDLVAADEMAAGLPALGQPTMALSLKNAAPRLANLLTTAASKNALLAAGNHEQIVNYAEELTRGYRVDVWDDVTKVWHPLCQRAGTYQLGDTTVEWGSSTELTDESWVQLAPTSSPDAIPNEPGELRLHEELFSWNGWSLVVPRPGAALAAGDDGDTTNTMRRSALGPDGQTYPLGQFDNPNLPLTTAFRVPPATLPRLRLGTGYRFRARVVDLAGHSESFVKGAPTDTPGGADDTLTTVTREIVHKRYEPVKPPVLVITDELSTGESPGHLVIHSNFNTTPAENTSRHVCPPRTSFTMAEAHGGFDAKTTGRPMDGSSGRYEMIAERDSWDFPHNDLPDDDPAHGQQLPLPTIPSPLPYLPDYASRGAALSGLPGQNTKWGAVHYTSTQVLRSGTSILLDNDVTATAESLRVPFETGIEAWHDRVPFRFTVTGIEGLDTRLSSRGKVKAPTWDKKRRELTVELPKAEQMTIELSSFVNAEDLRVMGVYQWGLIKSLLAAPTNPVISEVAPAGVPASVMTPRLAQLPLIEDARFELETNTLIDASVLGRNWIITPSQEFTIVHAVNQPMIAPNSTRAIKARRQPGDTTAVLIDWVQIHGKSTARLAMNASWSENIDDPDDGPPKWGPTAVQRSGQAFDIGIRKNETVALSLGEPAPATVTLPVTPVTQNYDPNAQRHSFGDTKHRLITYQMVAASRFKHYFSPETLTTRAGNTRNLHVRSTVRPAKPAVDLVIPAFKWDRSAASSTRGGGRVRVYLERPWFTSGDNEQLAVILWEPRTDMAGFEQLQQYVTEWGNDPVYRSKGHLPVDYPKPQNFPGYDNKRKFLHLAEYGGHTVTALAYDVDYDEASERWFADITIDQGNAYFPFIKLALARYQVYSLGGLELSPVVAVDAVQLTPDRNASIFWGSTGTSFGVYVNGRSYEAARSGYGPRMTLTVEKRLSDGFAWVPVLMSGENSTEMQLETYTPNIVYVSQTRTYWRKTVSFAGQNPALEYRAVLREYERHLTGGPDQELGLRPTYVDLLPVVPPA